MTKHFAFCLCLFAVVLLEGGALQGQWRPDTTALEAEIETTYVRNGQEITTRGKYYQGRNGEVREESHRGITISNTRAGTLTVLNDSAKEARVYRRSGPLPRPATSGLPAPSVTEGTVDGKRVSRSLGRDAQGREFESWTSKELGIVVYSRTQSVAMTTTRVLKGIQVRDQDPQLFEIPQDYKIVNVDLPTPAAPTPPTTPVRPPGLESKK